MMDTKLLNILLVDDDPDDTDLIRGSLGESTTFQFTLHVADQLSAGLSHLANKYPDIVLLDLDLPNSQGFDTLDRVKAAAPEVAVIALVGQDDEATGLKALQRGAQDYLVKNQLAGNLLRRSIRYALQHQRHRRSEQNLARAQSIAHLGSWDWDIVGQTLTWSDELYRIFGVSEETFGLTYDNIADMIHPDDRDKNDAMVQELLATADQLELEFRIVCPDGSIRHIHQTAQVTRDGAGEAQQAFGIMMDITERKQAEEALRASEARYRTTLDNMLVGCQIIDQDWRYVYVNDAVARQGRRTKEQLLGRTMMEVYPDVKGSALFSVLQRCMDEHVPDRMVNEFTYSDGTSGWFELSIQSVPEGLFVLSNEITRRKQAEEALRASEAHYRLLFTGMREGFAYCQMIFKDGQPWDFIYLEVNDRFEELTGLQDVVGKNVTAIIPGIRQTNPELFEIYGRVALTGYPEVFETYLPALDMWFSISVYCPQKERFVAVFDVITERKRAEEALIRERDLLHTLMDNIPDSIYFKDTEGRFTRINQAQARLLGCGVPEEALGKTDFDFYTQAFAQGAFDDEQRIVKIGDPLVGKVEQLRWPTGQARWVSTTKVPIRDNQKQVTGTVGISRDITDLKRAQEAEREQRALAEALADVAARLNSTLDLEAVLEHILATVGRIARHDSANVMLIESGIAHVVRHQGRIELEDKELHDWVIAETPTLSRMVESQEPLAIPDTQGSPLWIPAISWMRSYAGAPIRLNEEVIGFISLNGAEPNMFTAGHARRLQAFADQAAVAIKNAQLFGQTEQRAVYLAALNDASHRVARWGLDLDGVLQAIVTLLVERVGVAFARIWLADDAGEYLILRASAGLHTHLDGEHGRLRIADFPGHVGQVARERKPVLLNQIQGLDRFDQNWVAKHGLVSFAGYPLRKNDHLVAVLAIFSTEPLDPALLDMLGSFANQAAIAVENARLYRELEIHSDILEQAVKERTAELQQTKERVETILNYNPDPILLLKPDGAIEAANPAFKRVFGFEVEDLHRQLPTNLVIPDHAGRMQAALQSAIDEHQVMRLELTARHQNGATFDAGVALAPIQVGDTLLGVVCSVRDISALKEVERMKDAFVSNVSHELRTPITSLKLSHRLMEKNPAGRERYMGRLDREINRLDNLIEDLLRLSRLDQGRVDLDIQPIDLNTLAAQYVNDRTPLAESQELSILFKKGSDLPPVQADEGLIGQVMSILLTNAINYTPAGGKVTVRTHEEVLDGSQWVGFSVSDTGPGIIPDDQLHLFERFYRGQAGRDSGAPGTGLGLAIAHEIVERHQGRIEIESEGLPGQGSRFTVWLPLDTP